jgi:hypothetical protein
MFLQDFVRFCCTDGQNITASFLSFDLLMTSPSDFRHRMVKKLGSRKIWHPHEFSDVYRTAFWTFPERRQRVHTFIRLTAPFTSTRTL